MEGVGEQPLFLAGCASNQGTFHDLFDRVVLLTAPVEVLLARLRERTSNPFGKSEEEKLRILADIAEFEPRVRRSSDAIIDTDQPLEQVVAQVVAAMAQ